MITSRMTVPGARARKGSPMTRRRAWGQSRAAGEKGAPAGRRRRLGRLYDMGAALRTCAPLVAMLATSPAGAGSRDMSMVAVAAAPQLPLGARALGVVAS